MSFGGLVSPYHVTSREAPAMVALLLCDRVVTMMPAPEGEGARAGAERLAERVPRYARLIEAWRWSVPLWECGVLVGDIAGRTPGEAVHEAHGQIMSGADYSALRPLICEYADDGIYLRALAHDLLRGGPDPALTIPMAAGLDRFAARHGLAVARSHPVSLAQRQEERLWSPVACLALPVVLEGRAERVIEARELLCEEFGVLRGALSSVCAGADGAELRGAASAYRRAFARVADQLVEPDPDEVRTVLGEVSVRVVEMSSEAALLASVRAAASIAREPAPGASGVIALAGGRTVSLIVRVLGRR